MKRSDIFWKCWWWSATCGAAVAVLFLIVTMLPVLDWFFKLVPFFDVLVITSIVGCYFGAGYVGSRIVAKYYNDPYRHYVRRYVRFSIISFALLIVLAFSPLSFLMVLWSFIAPYCVLLTLNSIVPKQKKALKLRPRRKMA